MKATGHRARHLQLIHGLDARRCWRRRPDRRLDQGLAEWPREARLATCGSRLVTLTGQGADMESQRQVGASHVLGPPAFRR
jgi:hypothetical protein